MKNIWEPLIEKRKGEKRIKKKEIENGMIKEIENEGQEIFKLVEEFRGKENADSDVSSEVVLKNIWAGALLDKNENYAEYKLSR